MSKLSKRAKVLKAKVDRTKVYPYDNAISLINAPFFVAGALKIAYDLALYREFVSVRPPEEAGYLRGGSDERRA